jgi:ureidoglycolate lyase
MSKAMQTPAPRQVLPVQPLTALAFAPFGEVIGPLDHAPQRVINAGYALRFDNLAKIDNGHDGAQPQLSIFRTRPRSLPLQLSEMERHLLGSQLFMPLAGQRFLLVVAAAGASPEVKDLRAFLARNGQGVNLARGTWHHPLLALDAGGDFLVIDRNGPDVEDDCQAHSLADAHVWIDHAGC